MKQSHILAGVGVAMLVLFYVTSVQREGFGSCSPGAAKTSSVVDGGDLATIPAVASASDCGTKCCQNASCNGYTYHTTNKNCHLKSGAVTESAGPGVFTSAIVTRAVALPPLPAGFALPPLPAARAAATTTGAAATTTGAAAPPTPTPSSNTSTAGRTDWSDYISKIATVDELKDSLTNTAKSTYGSFWSTIASGIAKFGIVVIVGASIVVGVLIVWSIWRVFLGDSSSSPSQLTGPSLVR